jgi:hypothetical protein
MVDGIGSTGTLRDWRRCLEEQRISMPSNKFLWASGLPAMLVTLAACFARPEWPLTEQPTSEQVMLILRGVANSEKPGGQLDDRSALEYARRLGFRGEVLDVAGNTGVDSAQVRMATERIRQDERITAIYGFSGGGYNARLIWAELSAAERDRIRKVVGIGSPGVEKTDFVGSSDVIIKPDPPEGHMAGPKALLDSLGPESGTEHQ